MQALIFDLDGTLVDTVYAHVFAWQQALAEAGLVIEGWLIHRRIGMSGGLFTRAVAVDIGNLQGSAFGQSQPAGVDGGQADAMAEHVDAGEGSSDLTKAQDRGQGLDPLGLEETNGGPIPLESMLIEEFDSTEGNGTGHPGPAGDIGAVEEILPQFLIRDEIRGLVIVFSQFVNCPGIGFLGPR